MKKISIAVLVAVFASTSAFAAPQPQPSLRKGLKAAYRAQLQVRSEFEAGLVNRVSKAALDILVAQGVQALRDANEPVLATQFEREWKQQISLSLSSSFGVLRLGDHDPLSPWLANFYDTLVVKTKGLINVSRIVTDINKSNYALNVILKPNGDWRAHSTYDRVEYRKHFIPFANIVTYWVSLEACNYYAAEYKNVCSYAASALEHYMGRYVAATLSDQVYHVTTGEPIPPIVVPQPGPDYDDFENDVMQNYSLN